MKKKPAEIFESEPEILYAELKDNSVEISFNQADPKYNYLGGNLCLNCDSVKVFDQEYIETELKKLTNICNQYWEDWKIKNIKPNAAEQAF